MWWIDVIGYTSTALLFIGLSFNNMTKLRIVDMFSALFAVFYAILIEAYPTLATNILVICIHGWRLHEIRRSFRSAK